MENQQQPQIKAWKPWQILLVIIAMVIFGFYIFSSSENSTPPVEQASNNIQSTAAVADTSIKSDDANFGSNWKYKEEVDPMTNETYYYANLESPTVLDLKFPYNDGVIPTLTVRHGSHHNSVYLSVKAQFMPSGDGEEIKVKFDDGKPMVFSCAMPNDGNEGTLFIDEAGLFIKKLKSSKRLMIQALFYNNGKQTMEFGTQSLIWKH